MIKMYKCGEIALEEILSRTLPTSTVEDAVSGIISAVRMRGDEALREFSLKFDGVKPDSFEVRDDEINAAFDEIKEKNPALLDVIYKAERNIRAFHEHQVRSGFIVSADGVVSGQRIIPIASVGLYVPGGSAAYPSTVLMDAVPAKIAGCREIVMTTPPGKDGKVNPAILAAAKIAGVTRILKLGGAQAIAALAYGTESVPKVDKIVGPGNAYVAEAKKQVFGAVSIDMIAGPSEILVIADKSASPDVVAADMLSQAEHDRLATAVLVTDCEELADSVRDELEAQLKNLSRESTARESIDKNGKIIVVSHIDEAVGISNKLAPEHLELCVDNPFDLLDKVENAGSVFLGKYTPEAFGDYIAGANHTLPTGGSAKFSSPLSVDDFIKKSQFIYYSRASAERTARDVAVFAEAEGLEAHAKSALKRL